MGSLLRGRRSHEGLAVTQLESGACWLCLTGCVVGLLGYGFVLFVCLVVWESLLRRADSQRGEALGFGMGRSEIWKKPCQGDFPFLFVFLGLCGVVRDAEEAL